MAEQLCYLTDLELAERSEAIAREQEARQKAADRTISLQGSLIRTRAYVSVG